MADDARFAIRDREELRHKLRRAESDNRKLQDELQEAKGKIKHLETQLEYFKAVHDDQLIQ